jgi:hypothetical protein
MYVCVAHAASQPLPIRDVIEMSGSGVSAQDTIARIRSSKTTYALHGSDFGKLKSLGVPDRVLDYLQQSFVLDVDMLTRYWAGGESLGGCSFCYPQSVDLDNMSTRYAAGGADTPGHYRPSLPTGVPDWVRPDLRSMASKRLTLADIEEMSKRGDSDAQIIDVLSRSRLNVRTYGRTSNVIRTQSFAGPSGAEFARLHSEGLSDRVLDEVQARFLAQFIEAERLRYQNLGKKK